MNTIVLSLWVQPRRYDHVSWTWLDCKCNSSLTFESASLLLSLHQNITLLFIYDSHFRFSQILFLVIKKIKSFFIFFWKKKNHLYFQFLFKLESFLYTYLYVEKGRKSRRWKWILSGDCAWYCGCFEIHDKWYVCTIYIGYIRRDIVLSIVVGGKLRSGCQRNIESARLSQSSIYSRRAFEVAYFPVQARRRCVSKRRGWQDWYNFRVNCCFGMSRDTKCE